MNVLDSYKEDIISHGMMCDKYSALIESAISKKRIADVGMGVQSFDTICMSISEGWGITPEYISKEFGRYINGKYKSHQKGYTSRIYCQYDGEVIADSTAIMIIDCDIRIVVPDFAIIEAYCVGKCNITLSGSGRIAFVCYGNPDDIVISGECGKIKRINKTKRC